MSDIVAIIEDERRLLDLLVMNLEEEFSLLPCASAEEFLEQGGLSKSAVVVSDVRLPGMDGMELLSRVQAEGAGSPFIVMTAFGGVEEAVAAVKAGAYDYLTKPVRMERLSAVIRNALSFKRSTSETGGRLAEPAADFGDFLTRDARTRHELTLALRVSAKDVPVLILGETGCGKDLVARLIHERSARRGPLVALNCAAIPADLVEGELFGYGKGAFTGAASTYAGKAALADGGTLFLDEIGDMPLSVQAKFLRLVETGAFYPLGDNTERRSSFRVIAATHRDLHKAVDAGDFRQDLYYRLAVVPVRIPPLRERPADVSFLARRFLNEALEEEADPRRPVDERVYQLLESYAWPGNVRELRNVVMRLVLSSGADGVRPADFPRDIALPPSSAHRLAEDYEELKALKRAARDDAADALEAEFLAALLERFGHNVTRAAKAARMDRRLLQNLVKKHGLRRPDG